MDRPINIEEKAQLLEGVGANAWFYLSIENNRYQIKRYSFEGDLECCGFFIVDDSTFDINVKYKFTYISHCQKCTVLQNSKTYVFTLLTSTNKSPQKLYTQQ